MERGNKVRIVVGTQVRVWDGQSYHDEGILKGFPYYTHEVIDEDASRIVLTIASIGPGHATMNGGGHDFDLVDEFGNHVSVRSTFTKPETSIFVRV